ncbi:hypothetical protein TNCV_4989231 [Trichonephila clavipes]|nr:hypothetical protein TNCV_4989231 [Trichonephila clavipes]
MSQHKANDNTRQRMEESEIDSVPCSKAAFAILTEADGERKERNRGEERRGEREDERGSGENGRKEEERREDGKKREETEREKKEGRGERERSPSCMEKRAESGIGVKKTMNAGGVEKGI